MPAQRTIARQTGVLVLLAALAAPLAAHAQCVLLVTPDSARARLHAELTAVGANARDLGPGVRHEIGALRAAAARQGCSVLVWVDKRIDHASVWATASDGQVSHASVIREAGEAPGTVALRVAEFYDAWRTNQRKRLKTRAEVPSFTKLKPRETRPSSRVGTSTRSTSNQPTTPSQPQTPDAAPPARKEEKAAASKATSKPPPNAPAVAVAATTATSTGGPPQRYRVRIGPTLTHDGNGLSAGGHLRLGAAAKVAALPGFLVGAVLDMPVVERTLDAAEGSIGVSSWLAGASLLRPLYRWRGIGLLAEAGVAAVVTNGEGAPSSGYDGHRETLVSAAGWLGAIVDLELQPRWSIRLEADLVGLSAYPTFISGGREVVSAPSSMRLALTLEARL